MSISTPIAVTDAPSVFTHTATLVARCKYVRPAIGLHPELVHSHKHELEAFHSYLPQTRYVGEVGLDYSTTNEEIKSAQRYGCWARFANWVNECGDKVLTKYTPRRATRDVISIFERDQCSEAGRALVLRMPRDRVLTETDGPFVQDWNGTRYSNHSRRLQCAKHCGGVGSISGRRSRQRFSITSDSSWRRSSSYVASRFPEPRFGLERVP